MKSLRCGVAMHWSWCWRLAGPALRLRPAGSVGVGPQAFFRLPPANFSDALRVRHFEVGSARLIVEIRQRHAWKPARDRAFDVAHAGFLIRSDERERRTRHLGAGGSANAVDVVFRLRWHIEIDHVAKRGDVDAACRDVGGDENLILACS